jgi:hypothetical protein
MEMGLEGLGGLLPRPKAQPVLPFPVEDVSGFAFPRKKVAEVSNALLDRKRWKLQWTQTHRIQRDHRNGGAGIAGAEMVLRCFLGKPPGEIERHQFGWVGRDNMEAAYSDGRANIGDIGLDHRCVIARTPRHEQNIPRLKEVLRNAPELFLHDADQRTNRPEVQAIRLHIPPLDDGNSAIGIRRKSGTERVAAPQIGRIAEGANHGL